MRWEVEWVYYVYAMSYSHCIQPLGGQDTVCLPLWKRVFPKWPVAHEADALQMEPVCLGASVKPAVPEGEGVMEEHPEEHAMDDGPDEGLL
jgi:hypothetical protein